MNLNITEALKERTIHLNQNVEIGGDVDFGGRLIIADHAPRGPLITTLGPTRIRNASIICGTNFEGSVGTRPTAILARDQLVSENVRFENLFGWGIEFAGVHSGSRIRDCHFQYENAGQAIELGHCAVFCGGYNVEDVAVLDCSFDGADVADNFVWLSKGGNFRVQGCKIENFAIEALALTAGPAWVDRCWFRARNPTASACAALLWVDVGNRERGTAHYSLEPRFRFTNNEVSGCPCGVNAGRPDDRLIPMEMDVAISGNGFDVSGDAIILANCRVADVVGNIGSSGVFVRTTSRTNGPLLKDVSVRNNSVSTRGAFLQVSQEIAGLLRVEGNNVDLLEGDGPHLSLVKPQGGYSVQLHGNRGFRHGKPAPFVVEEKRYHPQSRGELAYAPGSLDGVAHRIVDVG